MSTPLSLSQRAAKAILLAPIMVYRYTFSALAGAHCRHMPSCSDYAREAIETNGAWKGGWLTLARLCRCHPWGSHGFDPVPDLRQERHPFTPWRYGRWRLREQTLKGHSKTRDAATDSR